MQYNIYVIYLHSKTKTIKRWRQQHNTAKIKMTYSISNKIAENFISKGYNVTLESSKTSDYLRITNPADKYAFKFVVRFSDHDAMTGRSECADLDYNIASLLTTFGFKFESGLIINESGDYDYEVTEFDSKEERDLVFFNAVIAEINYKLDF